MKLQQCLRLLTLSLSLVLVAACAASHTDGTGASGATIKRVWSVDVDQRQLAEPAGFSQPAVVESQGLIVIGGRDGRVRVYRLNGSEKHMITIREACDSGALLLPNGLVVVGDVGGALYGIDPVAGTIKWQAQLAAPFLANPVLLNDGFLVQTMDNRIYRYSFEGEKRWSFTGGVGSLGMYMSPSPLVLDGAVYAIFSSGDVVALKANSGDLLWRKQLLLNTDAPVLSELRTPLATPLYMPDAAIGIEQGRDLLLVSFYQGQVMALSRSDGRQLFSKDISIKSTPLIRQGIIYFATAAGDVEAVDLTSGATLWKQNISGGELLGPIMSHGKLWVADDRGVVIRMGVDGHQEASLTLKGRIERAPVATPAGVLVRTGPGVLTLLR
jgi:outer membrane protein assembly factor BamB